MKGGEARSRESRRKMRRRKRKRETRIKGREEDEEMRRGRRETPVFHQEGFRFELCSGGSSQSQRQTILIDKKAVRELASSHKSKPQITLTVFQSHPVINSLLFSAAH